MIKPRPNPHHFTNDMNFEWIQPKISPVSNKLYANIGSDDNAES